MNLFADVCNAQILTSDNNYVSDCTQCLPEKLIISVDVLEKLLKNSQTPKSRRYITCRCDIEENSVGKIEIRPVTRYSIVSAQKKRDEHI